MIVIDGSALVVAVTDTTDRGMAVRARLHDGGMAPHLVDAEVGQGLRGLVLRRVLTPSAAQHSLVAAEAMVVERFAHTRLWRRAWQLRSNVSFYDGLYVALAEALDMPLVTSDAKLAKARGPRCTIELA